eukprot:Colp12_sorted_trinity150504_noHs@28196
MAVFKSFLLRCTRTELKLAQRLFVRGNTSLPMTQEQLVLNPTAVVSYWQKLMAAVNEPTQDFLTAKPINPESSLSPDYYTFRTLLNKSIRAKRTLEGGDILPDIVLKQVCEFYKTLKKEEKLRFFHVLSVHFGVDAKEVTDASKRYIDEPSAANEEKLRASLVPPRAGLFAQIGQQMDGVKFLVDMRRDLLELLSETPRDSHLRLLSENLRETLAEWFSVGFLDLERITFNSPASLLEKLIKYEAVHPMRGWMDLKQRLGPGRRCFAFFHRSMPEEPLVVTYIALVKELASSVQTILDDPAPTYPPPEEIQTAVFYSISSTQQGLSGVELGNFLIKRVVYQLQQDFAHIQHFATLSPIPNFRPWLLKKLDENDQSLLLPPEQEALQKACPSLCPVEALKRIIATPLHTHTPEVLQVVKTPLMRLCARYLALEKKNGFALDPVANFHLRNGAFLWRLNFLADTSAKGHLQSLSLMVNYAYRLSDVEGNNRRYLRDGRIALGPPMEAIMALN